MRVVIQRVKQARVEVDGQVTGAIGPGLLVLLGIAKADSEGAAEYVVEKVLHLRIFPDSGGKMNLNVAEAGGSLLVGSQFTLYGDCRKGRRPSFDLAASPPQAGLPRGVTRSKAGPQPERLPHISNSGHSHFLSRQILLVEAVVLVVQIHRRSLDEHPLDLGARLQRVSVGNNQVGPLAFFDGAELVASTPDLGRIERDGLESFVVRQAETHRRRRFIRQVAGIIFRSRPEARESKFDARLR